MSNVTDEFNAITEHSRRASSRWRTGYIELAKFKG